MVKTYYQDTKNHELSYRHFMRMVTRMLSICSCRKLLHTGLVDIMSISD